MTAKGGASRGNSSRKRRSSSPSPSSSTVTPEEVFRILPFSPCRRTRRCINGRKPTPWTIPLIFISIVRIVESNGKFRHPVSRAGVIGQ